MTIGEGRRRPRRGTVKAAIALGGCVVLAATVAKTVTATAGTTTPAWVAWFASPAGKQTVQNTCGLAVVWATVAVSGDDDGQDENDDSDENDNPDPSDQKNVDNAKEQAIKDAEAERDAARKAWYTDPTPENLERYEKASRRHGCLLGQLKSVCDQ